jgi:hypothetical protein
MNEISTTLLNSNDVVPSAIAGAAFYSSKTTDPVSLARNVARGFRGGADAVNVTLAHEVAADIDPATESSLAGAPKPHLERAEGEVCALATREFTRVNPASGQLAAVLPAHEMPPFSEGRDLPEEFVPSTSSAAEEGALVVSGFRAGAQAVIGACVRILEVTTRFRDDPSAIDEFLAPLVDGKIISRSEARLGLASPKLSKLGAIGQHAEMLCREQVFRYLSPGYTVIYHVTVLFNVLNGDEAHRFEQLVRELESLSPLSREGLIARSKEIKRSKKGASTLPSTSDAENDRAASGPITNLETDCKLVLFTPDRQRDLWRLSEDYVAEPEFLRLGERLAEDAVAVVIAQLADIPLIENKLLSIFRFSYVSQVCLVRTPSHADVTDAEVLIIVQRKQRDFAVNFTWLSESDELEAKAIVEQLFPEAGKKLHLFASNGSDGLSGEWLSLVGNANWGEFDE